MIGIYGMDPAETKIVKEITKSLPVLVKQVYQDALHKPVAEIGEMATDLIKCIRLVAFPLQFAARIQDKLGLFIEKSIEKVPEEDRTVPNEQILISILDKIKFEQDSSAISDLYNELLASASNKNKQNLAHPSFVSIISNLSPDEALIISNVGKYSQISTLFFHSSIHNIRSFFIYDQVDEILRSGGKTTHLSKDGLLDLTDIYFKNNVLMYLDHLQNLGLIKEVKCVETEYRVKENKDKNLPYNLTTPIYKSTYFLTQFGTYFYRACIADLSTNASKS